VNQPTRARGQPKLGDRSDEAEGPWPGMRVPLVGASRPDEHVPSHQSSRVGARRRTGVALLALVHPTTVRTWVLWGVLRAPLSPL
jgi:hypothetical protein